MKLTTPQIVWHSKEHSKEPSKEPVFSADFHHSGELWRLATAGADKDVKTWKVLREEGGKVKLVFMASLSRHSGSVNVVRFSPNGELLASAGDDNVVFLWKLGEGGGASGNIATDTTLLNKETWNVTKMLRGHVEDIYDACWSGSSGLLVTGSVDNTAIIWDVSKGQALCSLTDSKQYVQGVAWDPIGQYLATLSNDRYLRVYAADQKFKCVHSISKMTGPPDQEKGGGAGRQFRMWIDESLSFFFRRLAFSPDGNLLVVPAGRYESGEKVTNMTYVFTKSNLTKPAVCLPCPEKATVVVKFCPKLFKLRDSIEKDKSLFSLPYRMVYAVASLDAVLLYDTQQATPFAYLSNMHYSGVTDLAWSEDGLVLVITSSDAYCSIVTFEPGELGVPMATEALPESMKKAKSISETTRVSKSPNENGKKSISNGKGMEQVKKIDGKDLIAGKRSPTAADSPTSTAAEEVVTVSGGGGGGEGGSKEERREGGRREAKGKRRIATTLMASFASPSSSERPLERRPINTSSEKAEPPQPHDPSSTSPPEQQPVTVGEETRLTGQTSSTVATGDDSRATSNSPMKKPRRIQFQTLSQNSDSNSKSEREMATETLPSSPGSCDLVSKSCDPGSAHSTTVEPMDVQTVE